MGRLQEKDLKISQKKEQNGFDDGGMLLSQVMQQPQERIVYLSGEVNEHTIGMVIAQLISLANTNKEQPIDLIVSTYGGSVDEMFSLYDVIKYLPCPIRTLGLGKVMSAGVLLLASGAKGERRIGRRARIMVHAIHGHSAGTVFDQDNELEETKRMQRSMVECLIKETSMSKEEVEKIMLSRQDYYIDAEKALQLGIVDKIIGS